MKKPVIVAIIAIALFGLMGVSVIAETIATNNERVTEYWQGKVLTATFRAGLCYTKAGDAKGVLILRHSNGQEDSYHLYGTVKDGKFDLRHSSGHHFYGDLPDRDTLQGKVKLAKSISLSLSGKRKVNAPLLAPDCAPPK